MMYKEQQIIITGLLILFLAVVGFIYLLSIYMMFNFSWLYVWGVYISVFIVAGINGFNDDDTPDDKGLPDNALK